MEQSAQGFINEILTLNNPLLFAICMTFLGKLIAISPLESKHITWILPLAGIPIYCFAEGFTGRHVMEGLIIGCAAIGLNQGFRQMIVPKTNEEPKIEVTPPPAPPTT